MFLSDEVDTDVIHKLYNHDPDHPPYAVSKTVYMIDSRLKAPSQLAEELGIIEPTTLASFSIFRIDSHRAGQMIESALTFIQDVEKGI